jgi:glycine betaine/proline transport system substrate-binding protein
MKRIYKDNVALLLCIRRTGYGRELLLKTSRKLLALILALGVGTLTAGCSGSEQPTELTLANIGWDENVALSNLTKVLLEEELGYESVEVHTSDLDSAYQEVADGDLDAFQDVWLPNQQALLEGVAEDVELLDPWFMDLTEQGMAVPNYMDVTSIDQLNQTNADLILSIEPSSIMTQVVADEVIPQYALKQKLVEAPTEGMLAELDILYTNKEDFAFMAWSPHWMNQRYDFRYLEDPKDALGPVNDPAECHTIVNEDLQQKDPVAYTFLNALKLTEEQINDLEAVINEAEDPLEGSRVWVRDNRAVVQPWIDAASNAEAS